jgi:NAD-dependent DNA ligase
MKIEIPTACPSCASPLIVVNAQLFCKNPSCEAQSSKTLEGFCKKMKIKGFGEKTLDKLEILTVPDLYQLTKQDLVQSTSDTVGSKLFEELQKSKGCSFEDFIKSLGINLIGASASAKIVNAFPDPFQVCTIANLRKAGLGEKASESFMDYINSQSGADVMELARNNFTFQVKDQQATSNSSPDFPPLEVCITGKLKDFKSRTAASEYLSQYNVTVKGSVVKSVSYLICEDEAKIGSSSYKKAESNNLPIITINELVTLLTQ